MAEGEGGALLGIVRQITAELDRDAGPDGAAGGPTFGPTTHLPMGAELTLQEEEFIGAMKLALAELAGAAGAGSLEGARQRVVKAALNGAELVLRGQVAMGKPRQLRMLLPSFVFLITLPIVEQDEALTLSDRAADLIEKTFGAA